MNGDAISRDGNLENQGLEKHTEGESSVPMGEMPSGVYNSEASVMEL